MEHNSEHCVSGPVPQELINTSYIPTKFECQEVEWLIAVKEEIMNEECENEMGFNKEFMLKEEQPDLEVVEEVIVVSEDVVTEEYVLNEVAINEEIMLKDDPTSLEKEPLKVQEEVIENYVQNKVVSNVNFLSRGDLSVARIEELIAVKEEVIFEEDVQNEIPNDEGLILKAEQDSELVYIKEELSEVEIAIDGALYENEDPPGSRVELINEDVIKKENVLNELTKKGLVLKEELSDVYDQVYFEVEVVKEDLRYEIDYNEQIVWDDEAQMQEGENLLYFDDNIMIEEIVADNEEMPEYAPALVLAEKVAQNKEEIPLTKESNIERTENIEVKVEVLEEPKVEDWVVEERRVPDEITEFEEDIDVLNVHREIFSINADLSENEDIDIEGNYNETDPIVSNNVTDTDAQSNHTTLNMQNTKYIANAQNKNRTPEQNKQIKNKANNLKNNGKNTFICAVCNEIFPSRRRIVAHLKYHTAKIVCLLCDKSFKQLSCLKEHIKIHTGEKPYLCHICSKRFKDKSTYNRHIYMHAGIKKHVCECGKKFARKNHLLLHKNIHLTENERIKKRFACNICHKTLSQKCSLVGHMRIHTGEVTHICGICNKTFYRKGHLTQHMVVHTDVRPFSCDCCGRQFSSKRNLIVHKCKKIKASKIRQDVKKQ